MFLCVDQGEVLGSDNEKGVAGCFTSCQTMPGCKFFGYVATLLCIYNEVPALDRSLADCRYDTGDSWCIRCVDDAVCFVYTCRRLIDLSLLLSALSIHAGD